MGKVITKEEREQKLAEMKAVGTPEGYLFTDAKYTNSTTKVHLVCPNGHDFKVTYNNFMKNGQRCKVCNRDAKKKLVGEHFVATMDAKGFNTSKIEYHGSKTPVTIGCPVHGFYRTTPENAVRFGCRMCAQEKRHHRNGQDYGDGPGYVYYLRVVIEGKTFFKVGLSRKDPSSRYKSQRYQDFTILANTQMDNFNAAFRIEQGILNHFEEYRTPKGSPLADTFGFGYTELFETDIFDGHYDDIHKFNKHLR